MRYRSGHREDHDVPSTFVSTRPTTGTTSSTRFVAAESGYTYAAGASVKTLSPPSYSSGATKVSATTEVVLDAGSSNERTAGTTTFALCESAGNCDLSATWPWFTSLAHSLPIGLQAVGTLTGFDRLL